MTLKDIIEHLVVLEKQNPNCKARLDVEIFNSKNESTFYDYGYDTLTECQPQSNLNPNQKNGNSTPYFRPRRFTKNIKKQ